jgi:hypothetical protein
VTAVWFRARTQVRERWRAWLALALLIGVTAGVVFAAAAGSRRTESAYPRFERAHRALSFTVSPNSKEALPYLDRVARLPQVIDSTNIWLVPGTIVGPHGSLGFPDLFPVVDPQNRFGVTINRLKILSGRSPDPARPDEAAMSSPVAAKLGIRAGSRVRFDIVFESDDGEIGDRTILSVVLKIVGVEIAPGELQVLSGQTLPLVHLTPAFARAHPDTLPLLEKTTVVRTRPGVTKADLVKQIQTMGMPDLNILFTGQDQENAVQRSSHYQGVALWVIAGLTMVTAIGIFGQALARQAFWESTEDPVLLALGVSRPQLLASALVRAAGIGVLAALIGLVVGVALSPLTPVGVVRPVEPNPGVQFDWFVLGIGSALTLALVVLLTAVPAWRSAALAGKKSGNIALPAEKQASRVGISLAGAALPPTTVLGVRMAIEPGRGRTSVPIRTTIVGTTFGIVALIAALTFSSSLNRLVNTPSLYGWTWDALTGPEGDATPESMARTKDVLKDDPTVEAFDEGILLDVRIRSVTTFALASTPVQGSVGFSLIEGRIPVAADEVALGSDTLRKVGARLGDRILVTPNFPGGQGIQGRSMRIVGRVAMPSFFFTGNQPGEGVALSLAGAMAFSTEVAANSFFVRFAPSEPLATGLDHLRNLGFFVLPRRDAQDLTDLRRVSNVPLVLAGILATMAAAMLVHTLLTSIRRRRRDLAILKTLGFVRRQVGSTVAWQASTLAIISLLLGVPIGVATGRLAWRLFTDQLGVIPSPVVPAITLWLLVPATLILANAIALFPGRIASRTRPAAVLRTE